jgi:hypothetical protein
MLESFISSGDMHNIPTRIPQIFLIYYFRVAIKPGIITLIVPVSLFQKITVVIINLNQPKNCDIYMLLLCDRKRC